jgi:hypothetical protein
MNALKSQHHQQSSYFIPKTDFEGFFFTNRIQQIPKSLALVLEFPSLYISLRGFKGERVTPNPSFAFSLSFPHEG